VSEIVSPFQSYLARLHSDLAGLSDGNVADYIPELAKAAPEGFAISFATIDGQVYSVGDSETAFSIQSVSKPFAYGGALARLGTEAVMRKVGVEPTGEAFNSIVLDLKNNRPFNPMVNAGAIAIAALTDGETQADRLRNMEQLFSRFAGRALSVDEAVFQSETATGHRNRAIAYLMLNSAMIDRPPEEVLEIYFRQCALNITTQDLAMMGATLANGGVNPRTGDRVLGPEQVRDVLTLMMSCGMYDYAGEWSYEVGLPAKSGVSGGILAVLPGQLSVAIWSPPLCSVGNSVRGVEACKRISRDFGLHLFMNAPAVENVIRCETRGETRHSLRVRNPRDRDVLVEHGRKIAVIELQGALYFASAERVLRHLGRTIYEARYVVLDLRRLASMDAAARRFFSDFLAGCGTEGIQVGFVDLPPSDTELGRTLSTLALENAVEVFTGVDAALEEFENRLLDGLEQPFDFTRFALDSIDLFDGLDRDALGIVQAMIDTRQFDADDWILRKGDAGDTVMIVARGSVSVWVDKEGAEPMRVGCLGPGQFFGELAALGGGIRTADVRADERVVCYVLSVEDLNGMSQTHPEILAVILRNIAREFGERVKRSDALIAALQ